MVQNVILKANIILKVGCFLNDHRLSEFRVIKWACTESYHNMQAAYCFPNSESLDQNVRFEAPFAQLTFTIVTQFPKGQDDNFRNLAYSHLSPARKCH